MSTRGVIAEPKGDGWAGVYHHSDSQPTGLGAELWAQAAGSEQAEGLVRALVAASTEDALMDDEHASPLHIEWVYVLSGHTLTVLGHEPIDAWDEVRGLGSGFRIRQYRHAVVWQGDLRGPEPDWAALEAGHRAHVASLPWANDLVAALEA